RAGASQVYGQPYDSSVDRNHLVGPHDAFHRRLVLNQELYGTGFKSSISCDRSNEYRRSDWISDRSNSGTPQVSEERPGSDPSDRFFPSRPVSVTQFFSLQASWAS